MTGRGRAVVAAAALALAGLVAAGCGVPIDSEPRAITRTTSPSTTQVPTTVAGSTTTQEVSVYFLNGDRLERQTYQVEGEPTLSQAINFVLEPPAEGTPASLGTAVPPGTSLRGVDVTGQVATIDLSSAINDVSGAAQKEAFAQIVFTALAFENVEKVRFLVDGEAVDAPTDDGNLAVVTADNYDKPLNPR